MLSKKKKLVKWRHDSGNNFIINPTIIIIFTYSFICLWFTSILHPGHVYIFKPEVMQQAIENSTQEGNETHVAECFSSAKWCYEETTTETSTAPTWGDETDIKGIIYQKRAYDIKASNNVWDILVSSLWQIMNRVIRILSSRANLASWLTFFIYFLATPSPLQADYLSYWCNAKHSINRDKVCKVPSSSIT